MVSSGLGGLGGLLVLAGFGLMLVCAIWNPFSMSALGLIPGGFAVGGLSLMATGVGHQPHPRGPRPVVAGRRLPPGAVDAVEQAALRLLRPQGALHRLHPVGGRVRLRRGVGREVPGRGGEEPPVPAYFIGGYPGMHTGDYVGSMVERLQHAPWTRPSRRTRPPRPPRRGRRGRRLLRRRRRRRGRRRLVVTLDPTPRHPACSRPGTPRKGNNPCSLH